MEITDEVKDIDGNTRFHHLVTATEVLDIQKSSEPVTKGVATSDTLPTVVALMLLVEQTIAERSE